MRRLPIRPFRDSDRPEYVVIERPNGRLGGFVNEISHRAHARAGYEEVDRVIIYRKSLPPR